MTFKKAMFCLCINVWLANGDLLDYASLCPYNTMCSSAATKVINESHLVPCCQKCSCAADCQEVGNCCADVKRNDAKEAKYPCVDIDILLNRDRNLNFRPYYNLWFHVIDSCPSKDIDDAFPTCRKPAELIDYVLVSDRDEEKVFKNRQCAICHGEEDFVVWNVYTFCPEIVSKTFETIDEKNEFLLSECAFLSLPPNDSILEKTRCYADKDVIDTCFNRNVSDELKEGCETELPFHNAMFFAGNTGEHTLVYSNIYCYLCNNPEEDKINDLCQRAQLTEERVSNVLVSFSALLNINVEETKSEYLPCRSQDIWDPFEKTCRPLLCHSGFIPVNGVCTASITSATGYSMSLLFEVSLGNQVPLSRHLLEFLDEKMKQFIRENVSCGNCQSHMYISKGNKSSIIYEWPLHTTEKCSTRELVSIFDRLVSKEVIRLSYGDNVIQNKIVLRVTFETPKETQKMTRSLGTKLCWPLVKIDRLTLQNCPRIELSTTEVRRLGAKTGKQNNTHKQLIENSFTNKTSICVEDYFELQKQSRSGNQLIYHKWLIVLISCLHLSL